VKGILIGVLAVGSAFFFPEKAAAVSYADFTATVKVPTFKGYLPQGMTYWARPGENMLVSGFYRSGHDSLLVAFSPNTGKVYGTARVASSHLGGIAIAGGWLFAQDHGSSVAESYRRYKLSDLMSAWGKSHKDHKTHYVKQYHSPIQLPSGHFASFAGTYGGLVYFGHYGRSAAESTMYSYKIGKDGKLSEVARYSVPLYVNGVGVTSRSFVFTSHGTPQGTATVQSRSTGTRKTFSIPNGSEGTVVVGSNVKVQFENPTVPRIMSISLSALDA
jgi:hypothetical protein